MHHGQTVNPDRRAEALFGQERSDTHPFGRLFPLSEERIDITALSALGRPTGPMDEGTGAGSPSNTPSIFTFLGQFIDHDITLMCPNFALGEDVVVDVDPEAPAPEDDCCDPCDPTLVRNGRNPLLDLDSVFGGGPVFNPELYDANNRLRLNTVCRDIIRNSGGETRLINEMRNDENLIIVQIQVLVMRFYNLLIGLGFSYASARQGVITIYHAILRYDYLPTVCDPAVVDWVEANNHPLYRRMKGMLRGKPAIPIEFAAAAFRFGHSQLRQRYTLNSATTNRVLFDLSAAPSAVSSGCGVGLRVFNDLRGDQPVTDATRLNFSRFVGSGAQKAQQIDVLLPRALFQLPPAAIAEPPLSLAERNLRRGQDFRLPTGQEVAAFLIQESQERTVLGESVQPGVLAVFSPSELNIDGVTLVLAPDINNQTPLWYYLLREAKLRGNNGDRLGPIGSRIVAETLLGLLSEPIPPGGSAAVPSLLASRIGSGATPPEAELIIQSSRVAQSPLYPGSKGDKEEKNGELPEDIKNIRTFKELVDFVEKQENNTGEKQKKNKKGKQKKAPESKQEKDETTGKKKKK